MVAWAAAASKTIAFIFDSFESHLIDRFIQYGWKLSRNDIGGGDDGFSITIAYWDVRKFDDGKKRLSRFANVWQLSKKLGASALSLCILKLNGVFAIGPIDGDDNDDVDDESGSGGGGSGNSDGWCTYIAPAIVVVLNGGNANWLHAWSHVCLFCAPTMFKLLKQFGIFRG